MGVWEFFGDDDSQQQVADGVEGAGRSLKWTALAGTGIAVGFGAPVVALGLLGATLFGAGAEYSGGSKQLEIVARNVAPAQSTEELVHLGARGGASQAATLIQRVGSSQAHNLLTAERERSVNRDSGGRSNGTAPTAHGRRDHSGASGE